jgi:ADP-heptose:LPS heptosyltransferase
VGGLYLEHEYLRRKMPFRFNVGENPVQPLQEKGMTASSHITHATIRKMLVIHQGALGDFILALPSLEVLRRSFRRPRTVFMGYPRILELVQSRFYGEEVVSIDQKSMASLFVRDGSLDFSLTEFFRTFDLIVVFGKNGGGNLIRNLKRVSRGEILHVNPFPRWDEPIHLADHLLKELSRYGISGAEGFPRLYLNEADREWAKAYWLKQGITPEQRSEVIVIHPGSGSRKKVWPLNRFLDLIKVFETQLSSRMVVVLGPAEGPEIRRAFEGENPGRWVLAKGLSLTQLASILEGCRLYIGNDSGISHLSAALGVPTIAIFGPTDPRVWAPRGPKVVIVSRKIPCSPCPQERFFQCQHLECLKGIGIGDVIEAVRKTGLGLRVTERR